MIDVFPKELCCGCEACVQACARSCISLSEDSEGFLYPAVNKEMCIKCGACKNVCPVLNEIVVKRKPVSGCAYRSSVDELLERSSSGGFFSMLAKKILANGGIVYGAALNSNNEVVHIGIETLNELDCIRRSKYVQSHIGRIYGDVKRQINSGRYVLFSGTPCQVKALKLFIGKEYSNLITVDFVCHGVPSPGMFKQYIEEVAKERGCSVTDIHEINFRAKKMGSAYSFSYRVGDNCFVERPWDNPFLRGFLCDIYLRKSCHQCCAKNFRSGSDYMMGDFWTFEKFVPEVKVRGVPGVSQVFVFNDKLNVLSTTLCDAYSVEFDVTNTKVFQRWVYDSVVMPRRRTRFYSMIRAGHSFSETVREVTQRSLAEKFIARSRNIIAHIIRRIIRK